MMIAIQPDDHSVSGDYDASSPVWARLLRRSGHQVRWVNVYDTDILDQITGCHGFMWRYVHIPKHRQIARSLLPVIEKQLGMAVFPDYNTRWHYDDKIAQYYLLSSLGIPIPRTWVWYDYDRAIEWIRSATYPLVAKLRGGAAGTNVCKLDNPDEAALFTHRLFTYGVASLAEPNLWPRLPLRRRISYALRTLSNGRIRGRAWDLHKNYVLFQEFVPDNDFDTRVVVIGDRVWGIVRTNRPGDFRASGSGLVDLSCNRVDLGALRCAVAAAARLNVQSLVCDVMRRGSEYIIGEISYTSPSWSIAHCRGHWQIENGDLEWHEGSIEPEQAQLEVFFKALDQRGKEACDANRLPRQ